MKIHLDGKLVDEADANVSVLDAGFQHGVGLFETLRTYGGRFFRLADHVVRIVNSAKELGLPWNLNPGELEQAIRSTVAANKLPDARVRLTVTRGRLGGEGPPKPTIVVTAAPIVPYPAELYATGMATTVCDTRQNETDPLSRHKTLLYFPRLRALEEARKKGCGETLFFNTQKLLAEGAISNVLLIKGDVLISPDDASGLLPGITRKVVLELAGLAGLKTQLAPVTIQDVFAADEVFLTNSIMEVMPVVSVERHVVGDGKPGARTCALHGLYREAVG